MVSFYRLSSAEEIIAEEDRGQYGVPIGPDDWNSSTTSTVSADSNFSVNSSEPELHSLPMILQELESLEEQLHGAASILNFLTVKVNTLKEIVKVLIENT